MESEYHAAQIQLLLDRARETQARFGRTAPARPVVTAAVTATLPPQPADARR